jgi:hypothetical protein
MAESKKDDVGRTGDGLGEGVSNEATNQGQGTGARDEATAESKGTIGSGSEDADLSQASGGSVD